MDILPASSTERVIWAIIVVVILGYVAGGWVNRRRSRAIGDWLQGGLHVLGKQASWKWLRAMSSGGQLTVPDAARPFRQVQISFYLLTREFAPLWAIEQLQKKHDLLALRANLRYEPSEEFDVVPIEGQLRALVDRSAEQPWQWQEGPGGLGIAMHGRGDRRVRAALGMFLQRYGPYIERLSVRRRSPNVMLFMRLRGLESTAAADLFKGLSEALLPTQVAPPPEG